MSSNAHLQSLMNTFDDAEASAPGSGQKAVDQHLSEVQGVKVDSSATSATIVETTAQTDPAKLVLPDPRAPEPEREPGMVTEAAPVSAPTPEEEPIPKAFSEAAQEGLLEPEIERWARDRHGVAAGGSMECFRRGLAAGLAEPGHRITAVSRFRKVSGTEVLFWELHRMVELPQWSLLRWWNTRVLGRLDTALGDFSPIVINRFPTAEGARAWLIGYRWGPVRVAELDESVDLRLRRIAEGRQT